jgi:plastocyanin
LKLGLFRALPAKLASALALCVAAALTLTLVFAGGASAEDNPANTVFISAKGGKLHFEAPQSITFGEELTILNTTNPKKVGPHTFALVTKGSIPKTSKQRQLCFTPHHICKAIAGWHGVKGNGPVKENPALAGSEGWDTLGSLTEKGDSWFTGTKPNATFTQKVTAAPGTTIYFMCAIHPWMHGKIEVLP